MQPAGVLLPDICWRVQLLIPSTCCCRQGVSYRLTLYPLAVEEGGERRVSKAGYDITPLTLAKQQELAAGLSAHQRCTSLACLPADVLLHWSVDSAISAHRAILAMRAG